MERIQQLLSDLVNTLLSLIRIIVLSKFNVRFVIKNTPKKACAILGNGPSLRTSLDELGDRFANYDLVCVNNFVAATEYESLKPSYYVMSAPEFWAVKPPTEAQEKSRNIMFSSILTKTQWPLTLFLPADAEKSPVLKGYFDSNKNITVSYYNSTPVEGFEKLRYFFFNKKLGMPRPYNVLNPCIYITLQLGYKELYLLGADHSWHEDIKLENNTLLANHQHFYDKATIMAPAYKMDGSAFRIHDLFRKIYLAFKAYHELREYADTLGARIYNASHKSYIDAFERKTLP